MYFLNLCNLCNLWLVPWQGGLIKERAGNPALSNRYLLT
ncbi:hypothetical protein SBF1_590009 [Candidatus Desulfosporosinus infrequens]|uniref:Uncharacterized protein n=1 Tax=Candidatus Desulfosporosinus infrequens TaxID=2043169 RepID=A0A2U3LL75_9FIRM|nr:hypothetical protein SBF1_590009 [Candidatus Desulfosporosinus infrequens]